MYITLESDYAVRIVTYLARQESRVDAKKISENSEVTLRFALKILRKLVAGKIIRSYKGTTGGYELMKKPSEISLADVIGAIEGPYCFSRCLNSENFCLRTDKKPCKARKVFADISKTVSNKLSKVTFDELI